MCNVEPANAQVCLYTDKGERIYQDNGKYYLAPNTEYTWTASCEGYVGKTDKITLTEASTLDITLDKAAEGEKLPQLKAREYPGFRADSNNQSVINAKTPITKESIEVKWERQMGTSVSPSSGSTPVIVDNKVYTQSGGKLYMLDKETGEVLKSSDCFMNAGFNLIPVTYADGDHSSFRWAAVSSASTLPHWNLSGVIKEEPVPATARSVMRTEGFM